MSDLSDRLGKMGTEWLLNSLKPRRDGIRQRINRLRRAYTTGPLKLACDVLADIDERTLNDLNEAIAACEEASR